MHKVKNWIPSIFIMLIIFLISNTPGEVINSSGLGYEPLHINGHFFLFFLLCISYYKGSKDILLSVLLTILYGISDEIHQMYIPGRSSNMFDIYTDSFGAIIAGIILWKLQHIIPKKLKNWLNN